MRGNEDGLMFNCIICYLFYGLTKFWLCNPWYDFKFTYPLQAYVNWKGIERMFTVQAGGGSQKSQIAHKCRWNISGK